MLRISVSLDSSYQKALDKIQDSSTSSFVLYYCVVIGFCALLRCLVTNRVRDCPLRPRLLEAITCGELYACWLGHLRVALVYGSDVALVILAGVTLYRWMTQSPGTTANPLSYMLAFVIRQCCMTVEEMCTRVAFQIGCALMSHTVASVIWQQSMLPHTASLVAALHCGHPDVTLDTPVTAAGQFMVVLLLGLITLKCGSVVVDLWEMIGQLIINGIIFATGHNDGVYRHVIIYLNPLVSISQLITCPNSEMIAQMVIYWLISFSAVLMVSGISDSDRRDSSGCSLDRSKQRRSEAENTKVKHRQRSESRSGEQNEESAKQQQQRRQRRQHHHSEEKNDRESGDQHSRRDKTGKQRDKGTDRDRQDNVMVCAYDTRQGRQQCMDNCAQWFEDKSGKQRDKDTGGKNTTKTSNQHAHDSSSDEETVQQPHHNDEKNDQSLRQNKNGKEEKESSGNNIQHTNDSSGEEIVQQQRQDQPHQNEDNNRKKSIDQRTQQDENGKQQDKETDQEQLDESRNGHNDSRSRLQSNDNHREDRQKGVVVCAYGTRQRALQCADDCMQWQCKRTEPQLSCGINRSTNAKYKDDDDDYRTGRVARAFRTSELPISVGPAYIDDEDRLSAVHDETTASQTTDSSTDNRFRSRTASRDDTRRCKDIDERQYPYDRTLIITRSSTTENEQRTASDNLWSHYYEDRCLQYINSDEGDYEPEEQS